jgi:FlaG/FlaF family flagellin (archaellin)
MTKLRRFTTVLTGLLLALVGVLAAAPAAFAMRVVPPGGDPGPPAPTYIVTQTGMTGWQVALIAIATALAAVALTTVVVRARFRTRLHPADS